MSYIGEYLTKKLSNMVLTPYYLGLTAMAQPEHANSESLRCAACQIPILNPTIGSGHWQLAHCRHPLHLDCLAPLGRPYAISGVTQRPYYVHNPGYS